jgi:MOSC domain-containing protein YiiM
VRLRGIRLCEPCTHLQKLTGVKVLPGLVHRGGLRAEILRGGKMSPGMSFQLAV